MKNLPDDYFLDIDDDLLAFLEAQGEECIKDIYQSNTVNRENGYKLLSILIVGIGSSFLLLTQRSHIDFLSAGLAVFTVYWSACAVYLVLGVLSVQPRGLVSATPNFLYTEDYKTISEDDFNNLRKNGFSGESNRLSVMRRYRLNDLCVIADGLLSANKKIRIRSERVRIAVILTPVCAIFISAVTYLFL